MSTKSNGSAEVRKENLRILLAQWGGLTNLARKLHYSGPSYISQLLSGNRPFTEKTARAIEARLDLPASWLDRPHQVTSDIDPDLLASVLATITASLAHKGTPAAAPRQLSEVVTLVYEQAQQSGTVDEAYVSRLLGLLSKERRE